MPSCFRPCFALHFQVHWALHSTCAMAGREEQGREPAYRQGDWLTCRPRRSRPLQASGQVGTERERAEAKMEAHRVGAKRRRRRSNLRRQKPHRPGLAHPHPSPSHPSPPLPPETHLHYHPCWRTAQQPTADGTETVASITTALSNLTVGPSKGRQSYKRMSQRQRGSLPAQ